MACLSRCLFNRQRHKFTLSEDRYIDTVFKDEINNSVQIGRYIRREDTYSITTIHSERLKQQKQLRQSTVKQMHSKASNSEDENRILSQLKIQQTFNGPSIASHSNNTHTNQHNNAEAKNNFNTYNSCGDSNSIDLYKDKQSFQIEMALKIHCPAIRLNSDEELEKKHQPISNHRLSGQRQQHQHQHQQQKVKFFIGSCSSDENSNNLQSTSNSGYIDTDTYDTFHSSKLSQQSYTSLKTMATSQPKKLLPTLFTEINSNELKKRIPNENFIKQQAVALNNANIHIPKPPPLPAQPLVRASMSCMTLASLVKHSKQKPNCIPARSATELNISRHQTAGQQTIEIRKEVERSCADGGDGGEENINALTNSYQQLEDNSSEVISLVSSPVASISKSTKLQRLEGGLIFTRTNYPERQDAQIKFIAKNEITRNLIRNAIERNDFLNNYMDNERKEMVIDAMEMLHIRKDSFIINENDDGSEIYVSEKGQFDVIKDGKTVGYFGEATVFGELAILYNAKRFASVRATTNAIVWKIDRDKFRKIMVISESKEREENLNFLRTAPFLNDLSDDILHKVADLLQRKFYAADACIVCEGDIGNEFFIIRGGTVTIKKRITSNKDGNGSGNGNGDERIVDRRKRGDYFGEQALLNADCRQASVYADPPGTEVLKLDREAFISYLGTIPQLRELPIEKTQIENRSSHRQKSWDKEYRHIALSDLKKIATLGAGAFGKVDLVASADAIFALKIIKKIDVVRQEQIEHVYNEKHVMMKCRYSPFITELYKTFRDEKFVYFLMEACMGGDVWTLMSQRHSFDEKTARFIAGCVVEAFDYLHSHNIIYRDLKPENLMLTTDGYCKLVDFGFAKQLPRNQKTHTFAGTPEYVAPEIILDRGHDRSVDYWALGILIFELLTGKTPFRGHNQIKIYQQILGGIDVVQMPSKIPRHAQSLIKNLCKQLPAERLGYQRKGIIDIKRHNWFDSLDFLKLKTKQLMSPIKRPISNTTDLRYFGGYDATVAEPETPMETSGWDIDF